MTRPPSELRIDLLEEAIRLTSGDRNKSYGPPTANMQRTADLFALATGKALDAREAAMFNVVLKLARIFQTPGHRDSYVDAMAYLGIAFQAHIETTQIVSDHVDMKPVPHPAESGLFAPMETKDWTLR